MCLLVVIFKLVQNLPSFRFRVKQDCVLFSKSQESITRNWTVTPRLRQKLPNYPERYYSLLRENGKKTYLHQFCPNIQNERLNESRGRNLFNPLLTVGSGLP